MLERSGEDQVARWVRAALFAPLAWWALHALQLTPTSALPAVAFVVGALALFAPGIAVLLAIVLVALPVLAADLATGSLLLLAGAAAIHYLALGHGRAFLFIGYTFLLAAAGPAWAIPALAGLWLGASGGAVVALIACTTVQVAGIIAGVPSFGPVPTGAGDVTLALGAGSGNVLGFGWLADAAGRFSFSHLAEAFSSVRHTTFLFVQPFVWATAAAAAGSVRTQERGRGRPSVAVAAAVAGVAVAAGGSVVAAAAFAQTPAFDDIVAWALGALVTGCAVAAGREVLMPLKPRIATARPAASGVSLSAEDADVDELLSLIAHAEDAPAATHAVDSVVMITDMKAFSAMTEEDGSMISAKTIQRHRDLLMPLITAAGGSGKSTGGDGLVAAFPGAAAALRCAASLQRALKDHNAAHASERDIIIRIGVARGEVVLDRSGRPFIGAGLSLAARVMGLADGGQVFVTSAIASAADEAGVRTHSHGVFALKNISDPTEVIEVLWWDGQRALAPRGTSVA